MTIFPWRVQVVQQQNPDRIKLRILQKIANPIMKVQVNMKSKVFRNPSQSTWGFENFGGGSVGCLKITEEPQNVSLKREGRVSISNANLVFHQQNTRGVFPLQTQISHSMTKRKSRIPSSNVDLNQGHISTFFTLQTWACDLGISTQMQACVAPRFNTNVSMWAPRFNAKARPASKASPASLL